MNEKINAIISEVKRMLPYAAEVDHITQKKLNGVGVNSIMVRKNGKNVASVINIEQYLEADLSISETASVIVRVASSDIPTDIMGFGAGIVDYDSIKHSLFLRIVNLKMNEHLWDTVPFRRFLDLAVVVSAGAENNPGGVASTMVTRDMLDIWHRPFQAVYDAAFENFKKEKSVVKELGSLLEELAISPDCEPPIQMNILTNEKGVYGAVRILDIKTLLGLSENVGGDILIIPSSIHECILLPFEMYSPEINYIIQSVNKEQVAPEEVLSDHAYIFRAENSKIEKI